MARFAVLIYNGDSAHRPGVVSDERASCDLHAQALERTGAMVAAFPFTPRDMASSVRGDVIAHEPYLDTPHIVAGIYILEAPDLHAALEIARLNPACQQGGGVEVRPIAP